MACAGPGCCGVGIITRVAKNAKRASTRKHLRGIGKLCSSAVYINFLTSFCAAYSEGRLTIE